MVAAALAVGLLLQGAPGRGAVAAGVVTGQIQTRDGVAATAVRVAAIPAPPPGVRPQEGLNYYVPPPPVRVTETDAQGRYRLTNIPPGRYLIAAGLAGYATYYPAQTDVLQAEPVSVTADAPAMVDIRMLTPTGGHISGRVTPPPSPGSGEVAILSGVSIAELAEVPVEADGRFTFGRVPPGRYLVSVFPTPPGFGSILVEMKEADADGIQIRRPTVYTVSGRVVPTAGPIPYGLLALVTDTSYVPIVVNPDGTFTVRAHSGQHRVDFAGLPSGYAVTSVRLGGKDVSHRVIVSNADVSGVEIALGTPRNLPSISGTITGLTRPATVEMRGPIVGVLKTDVGQGGTFRFPAAPPGVYSLRVPEVPELGTTRVVVTSQGATDVQLKVPQK